MTELNLIATIATLISLVFGLYQYYNAAKISNYAKAILKGSTGNVAKIQQSTEWSYANFRSIRDIAIHLPESDQKKKIIQFLADGMGDAASADRLVVNLFGDMLASQEAQFKTRDIKHPEKNKLSLWIKELENRT